MTAKGYEKFLIAEAQRRKRGQAHLMSVLAEGLNMSDPNIIDQIPLHRAAAHAFLALESSGWELVFDEEGAFKWVVT